MIFKHTCTQLLHALEKLWFHTGSIPYSPPRYNCPPCMHWHACHFTTTYWHVCPPRNVLARVSSPRRTGMCVLPTTYWHVCPPQYPLTCSQRTRGFDAQTAHWNCGHSRKRRNLSLRYLFMRSKIRSRRSLHEFDAMM